MSQKGFTLLELLVSVAIAGLVMVAAVSVIFHIFYGGMRNSDQFIALNELAYITGLIKSDIQMAQYTSLTDGDPTPQNSLELMWVDYTSFTTANESVHGVTYTLSGSELLRNYDGNARIIGRHITYLGFIQNDNIITCNVSASSSSFAERNKNLVFDVILRTW
ncbi:MAG: prepilin-type N-terminal cleavage/methylation domain-containing protein [Dehalococcoidia bacterium]|nr:MAG: prepilin-type N-terminal cleavage/methylation domain-containing protein [Dehalococcoidia bacterium]